MVVSEEMDEVPVKGLHRIEVQDKQGNRSEAKLLQTSRSIRHFHIELLGRRVSIFILWFDLDHIDNRRTWCRGWLLLSFGKGHSV